MRRALTTTLVIGLGTAAVAQATDPDRPNPVPLTRPELKQYLEDLKGRPPRIPLPEPADKEKAVLGDRNGYEARLRDHYLPGTGARGAGARETDPNMSLDYAFKTMLFWIVSRANNCHY